jgi:hypothetical protein
MKTYLSLAGAVCLIIASIFAFAEQETPIQVSPQTLLLGVTQSSVTVHAAVPYVKGLVASILIDGETEVVASATFADSRGELVAKFKESEVKDAVTPPSATVTLYYDGEAVGSTTVVVRKCVSPRR